VRNLIGLILMAVASVALAQGNSGRDPDAGEVLNARWLDPTTALYTMQCESKRTNKAGQGQTVDTPVQQTTWNDMDYASWVAAAKRIAELQAELLETWGQMAAEGDESGTYGRVLGIDSGRVRPRVP
jgi:hypothetical protein